MLYLVIIIIGISLSLVFDGKSKTKKNLYIYIYMFILILVSAVSDNLGGDACTYRNLFDLYNGEFSVDRFNMWTVLHGYMPLWTLVNELAVAFNCTYTFVQALIALSINVVVCLFIKNNTGNPFITIVIYFLVSYFYLNFEIQREAFAIAIGFVGLVKYQKGNHFLGGVCTSIAILFHISAVCLLMYPFIPKFRLSWFRLLMAFCICLLLYVAGDFLVGLIPSFHGSLGERVAGYANKTVTIFGFLLHTIRRLFIPFISYLIVRKYCYRKYKYIDDFIPFYLCLSVLACSFPGTFRFLNYMIPVSILIMADLVVALFKNKVRGIYILLSTFVLYLYVIQNVSNMCTYYPISGYHRYDLYLPYSSIFEDNNDYSYRDQIHRETQSGGTSDNIRTY